MALDHIPCQPIPAPVVVDFSIKAGQVLTWDGDSVTAGQPNPWMTPLQASITTAYTNAGKTVPTYHNTAVGGRTSSVTLANVATPIATTPDHIFLLSSVNDPQAATPVPATQTQWNYLAYFAAVLASRPNCLFHVVSNMWGTSEQWPDGIATWDVPNQQTNRAIRFAVANCPGHQAEYLDIRTPIYAIDAPADNPSNLSTGVLTVDGTHPTTTGASVMSTRALALLTLNLS